MVPAAKKIMELLRLEPHPTCGFVAETFRSSQHIPKAALPAAYESGRPLGSALYFMVTPEAHMRLHSNRADQMYQHYLGDPLEVLLLYRDGRGEVTTVGSDLDAGMRPILFIPGSTFHVSRLVEGAGWALLGATAWPGVEPPDIEQGDPGQLAEKYPAFADAIRSFTRT